MVTARTVGEVHRAILAGQHPSWHLIGVDGFMEAGKTPIALELADLLGGRSIQLDSYADRDIPSPTYSGKLRLDDLRMDLARSRGTDTYLVVEGVCLLDVLDLVDTPPATHLYIKRISAAGIWHDGVTLEEFAAEGHATLSDDWLRRDILRYHLTRAPHRIAAIQMECIESPVVSVS